MVFYLDSWDSQAATWYVKVFTEMNISFAPSHVLVLVAFPKVVTSARVNIRLCVDSKPFGLKTCSWDSFCPRSQDKVQSQEVFDAHAVPGRAC